VFAIQLFDAVQVFFAVEERPPRLVEVQRAFGHSPDGAPGPGAEDPLGAGAFGKSPGGHPARGPAGKRPVRPPPVFRTESAPQFDGIRARPVENVVVHDRQLLDGVVDPNGSRLQPQRRAKPRVGDGRDAGRPAPPQVHRHPVRLAGVQCGKNALARGHDVPLRTQNTTNGPDAAGFAGHRDTWVVRVPGGERQRCLKNASGPVESFQATR